METVRISAPEVEPAPEEVSDEQLASLLGIDSSTVAKLGRGRMRRFAPDGVGPSDLAAPAARRLLDRLGIEPSRLGLIVFATNTPDLTFPGSACLLQAHLGAETVGCLDVRMQCCGFVAAVEVARRFVGLGTYEHVLVAAAEVPSHQNRFDGIEPELACLTADGAGVVLVGRGVEGPRVLSCAAETDGRLYQLLWCEFPASRYLERTGVKRGQRLTRAKIEEGAIYPRADFPGLKKAALEQVPGVFDRALSEAGLTAVDVLIVRHVLPDVERELEEKLAAKAGRIERDDSVYMYAASLPLALASALAGGRIEPGETVALVTAGSGASWGTMVVEV
ncbi:MAG: hypothetical protein D6760_03090 [Deltaproteobacteria bacterium]|nr:MAG: hypothetical protein D6760_03090 [Deltaproteobacteria bacterium]